MDSKNVKIVVFVPETHTDIVREAMGEAGAGVIGNYTFCTFSFKGIGRFKPEKGANPHIGKVGKLEEVVEERIEIGHRRKQRPHSLESHEGNQSQCEQINKINSQPFLKDPTFDFQSSGIEVIQDT